MPRYKIEFDGVGNVRRSLGRGAARRIRKQAGVRVEQGVDNMAHRSFDYAPKDTTALAHSIMASVHKEAPLTWVYGSTMPYAQRQEYEHKTKKAYFRRAIWFEMPLLKESLEAMIKANLR